MDTEFPGKEIKAHLFGYESMIEVYSFSNRTVDLDLKTIPSTFHFRSTVNGLGSPQSDVDVCLTTPWVDTESGVSNMFVTAKILKSCKE